MHALLAMSRSVEGSQQLIQSEHKPVMVIIGVVRQARYTPLLQVRSTCKIEQLLMRARAQAALQWLVVCFNVVHEEIDPNPLEDKAFIRILVQMLQPRMGSKDRHPPAVSTLARAVVRVYA